MRRSLRCLRGTLDLPCFSLIARLGIWAGLALVGGPTRRAYLSRDGGFVVRLISADTPVGPRHGIADEDIEHAINNAMAIDDQDDDVRLYLGPARNAELLEVGTIIKDDGTELAIHAMRLRPEYHGLLRRE